jgi:hypothetical protein
MFLALGGATALPAVQPVTVARRPRRAAGRDFISMIAGVKPAISFPSSPHHLSQLTVQISGGEAVPSICWFGLFHVSRAAAAMASKLAGGTFGSNAS